MATNTTKLQQAYEKYNEAIKGEGAASVKEYEAQKAEVSRDSKAALQNAYINNERAAYREGQVNRAAGLTGGQAVNAQIGRENAYNNARTETVLAQERSLGQLDRQIAQTNAQTDANIAAQNINRENALLSVRQNDESGVRSVYAAMLQNKYIPKSTAEAQKMADSLGLPLSSLQAYINYVNNL